MAGFSVLWKVECGQKTSSHKTRGGLEWFILYSAPSQTQSYVCLWHSLVQTCANKTYWKSGLTQFSPDGSCRHFTRQIAVLRFNKISVSELGVVGSWE